MGTKIEGKIVLRYCTVLDEFVKVRIFTPDEINEILRSAKVTDKKSFIQLVINSCLVNYNDYIVPKLEKKRNIRKDIDYDDELYRICIEVNPQLEISQVSIPAHDEKSEFYLLQKAKETFSEFNLKNVLNMTEEMQKQIIGQDEAIAIIARAIKRAFVGLKQPEKPIGSFMFVGQTGTGKTEMAKVIARTIFGSLDYLIRIDCSEYSLPHEYAKLIGAPPGYIGYQEGGVLTNQMKKKKKGVVLFDEIEKADPKVYDLLLQMMDEGFITDSSGERVLFDKSIIIMTSNLGAREIEKEKTKIGFNWTQNQNLSRTQLFTVVLDVLKNHFKPEFLNRIMEIVLFNFLNYETCQKIMSKFLNEFREISLKSGFDIKVAKEAIEFLTSKGYSVEWGARELKRTMEKYFEAPFTDAIIASKIVPPCTVKVSVGGENIKFSSKKKLPKVSSKEKENYLKNK